MSKELYIKLHEKLVDEYLSEFPHVEWAEAYEATADAAYDKMLEYYADMADYQRSVYQDHGF